MFSLGPSVRYCSAVDSLYHVRKTSTTVNQNGLTKTNEGIETIVTLRVDLVTFSGFTAKVA